MHEAVKHIIAAELDAVETSRRIGLGFITDIVWNFKNLCKTVRTLYFIQL